MPLVIRYVGDSLDFDYAEGRAYAVYAELATYIGHATVPSEVVSPLANFAGPDEAIKIADDVEIRPIGETELDKLARLASTGIVSSHEILMWTHCVVASYEAPKNAPVDVSIPSRKIGHLVRALRILKSGAVSPTLFMQSATIQTFGSTGTHTSWSGSLDRFGPTYQFDQSDVEPAKELYAGQVVLQMDARLEIALHRLDVAYERARAEDRIIDYWIGLEALYLRRNENAELAYRAALRVAYALETDPVPRKRMRKKVAASYNARSDIVHGAANTSASKWAEFTESVLRRSLKRAILEPGSIDIPRLERRIEGREA
jgi:hypothetical protein